MTGKKLREFLFAHNIKVTDAAAACGVTQQALSHALNSKDVKSGFLEAIADLAGVPVAAMYGGSEGAAPVAVNSHNTNNGRDMNIGNCAALVDKALGEIAEQRKLAQQAIALATQLSK